MENRRNIKTALLITLGLFITTNQTVAYNIETHAFLTQKAYETYAKAHSNNQVTQELLPYLIDGARREDDPPRWMNHFYDPIKNRGLSYDPAIDPVNTGNWQKSKDWAQDSKNQTSFVYSPVIATVLSAMQSGKIQPYFPTSDFTWNEALRYWIQGEKEMALFTLGHILHLMEDTSVPDHTRNDTHPEGSPYENYAKRFNPDAPDYANAPRNAGLTPKILPNLDSFFTDLAVYSNNNFYSKDTIGIQSGYSKPQPTDVIQIGNLLYGIGKDESGKELHLYTQVSGSSALITTKKDFTLENNVVMNDYWNLLSKKAIEYSAGVIDLFFQEAEKNKNNPEFLTKKKTFIGQIIEFAENTINSIFGGGSSNNEQIITIPISSPKIVTSPVTDIQPRSGEVAPQKSPTPTYRPSSSPKTSPASTSLPQAKASPKPTPTLKATLSPKPTPSPSPVPNTCSIPTNATPTYSPILITEIAWMGTTKSAANEWIELKNISNSSINLSGWGLKTADGSVDMSFPSITIQADAYALLERTDDTSMPGIKADIIYTGTLANEGEKLYLFNAACGIIDALTNTKWQAGNASSRKTMERNESTRVWYTSSITDGTPKRTNSTPSQTGGSSSGGGVGGSEANDADPTLSPSPSSSPAASASPTISPFPSTSPSPSPIFTAVTITEIYYDPIGADNGREWIEIFNEDTTNADLLNWKHTEKEGTKHTITPAQGDAVLSPGEYAIIAYDTNGFLEEFPGFSGMLLQSSCPSCSIKNESDTLALYNSDLKIDSVEFDSSWGASETGNSLQITESVWCPGAPTPGEINICGPPEEVGEDETTDTSTLTLEYLASLQDTPEEERDMQRFAPALVASWQGELQENEHYLIEDVSDPDNPVKMGTADVDYYRFQISEVGRTYAIRATALTATTVGVSYKGDIDIPAYASNILFTSQESPTVELQYDAYPFIPDLYTQNTGSGSAKLVIFFLNSDPATMSSFHVGGGQALDAEWSEDMRASALPVSYRKCNNKQTTAPALVLNDNAASCPVNQNYIHPNSVGASSIHIDLIKEQVGTLSPNDFLTVAYYVLGFSSAGGQTYYLAATDPTRYYFQE